MKKHWKRLLSVVAAALAVYAVVVTALAVGELIYDSPKRLAATPAEPLTEIGSPYKFYYNRLDTVEQHLYNRILSEVYAMPEEIRVPSITGEQLDHVFSALLYDNPDLIFLGRKCTLISRPFGTYCAMEYIMEPAAYAAQKQKLEAVADKVLSALTAPEDPWQTELEIHDYVVDHCRYEIKEGALEYSSAYGALVNGVAACEGYSKAAKLLMDRAGIENALISGQALGADEEPGAHMWNVVKLGGNFYHLDCTWDDPLGADGQAVKLYAYFNVDDAQISSTHSDFTDAFHCTHMEENYYVKTGTYFTEFGRAQEVELAALLADALERGAPRLQLRFATAAVYAQAVERLVEESRIHAVLREAEALTGRRMSGDALLYYKEKTQRTLTFQLQ